MRRGSNHHIFVMLSVRVDPNHLPPELQASNLTTHLLTYLVSLGRWAEFICTIFSVLAILGAAIVYWVLMSNFLYSTVQYAVDLYAGVDMNDTGNKQ